MIRILFLIAIDLYLIIYCDLSIFNINNEENGFDLLKST